eukprot:Ihof_evm1s759 gene=Ihof_evmTU1s759
MARDKKTAKGRLDRFYHMAKEQGFRSRAAFKLIQLNKKFNFLSQSRCVLDLCAAPGGWMQVAAKYCPVSSIIIGVDLDPIKSIGNCITLQEDITTEKCRQNIRKELKQWEVDCVLHDGAPNVGTAWVQDAFTQVELALRSLQLATEFLKPGGWFVTKVFRSKDYFALMWVLNQLFNKVHATKPQASRNVSAEIFVVCQGYKAPAKLDPRMLDPKYVFKEVDAVKAVTLDTMVSTKKKAADGYEEGNYQQHKKLNVEEFLKAPDAITFLASVNQIALDGPANEKYFGHWATNDEIKACCTDIRVLGKKELRSLIKWRDVMRKAFGHPGKEEVEKVEEVEEEEEVKMTEAEKDALEIEEQIATMEEDEKKKEKLKKRKAYKEKIKLRERLALKMDLPGDKLDLPQDEALFALKTIKTSDTLGKVVHHEGDEDIYMGESDSDEEFNEDEDGDLEDMGEGDLDVEEARYRKQRERELDEIFAAHQLKKEPGGRAASKLDSKKDVKAKPKSTMADSMVMEEEDANPLMVNLEKTGATKADMWFAQDEFKDVLGEEDDDELAELEKMDLPEGKREAPEEEGVTRVPSKKIKSSASVAMAKAAAAQITGEQPVEADDGDFEVVKQDRYSSDEDDSDSDNEDEDVDTEERKMLDPEGLALGNLLLKKKTRMSLIDDSYNRHAYGNEDLPAWFEDHQEKFNKAAPPVPKDIVEYYKAKLLELDARPIKRVAEAKARKKMKEIKKITAAKKKAEAVLKSDLGDRAKSEQ